MDANLSLSRFNSFSSSDLDAVRSYVGRLFCQHQLDINKPGEQINTRLCHMEMSNSSFVYLDYGAPVIINPGCLQDFYLLQIVLEGNASVSNGQRVYTASSGEATLINPNEPITITSSEKCRFLSIRLNKKLIHQQLTTSLQDTPSELIKFKHSLNFQTEGGQAIYHYIRFLLDEINLLSNHQEANTTFQFFEKTLVSMLIDLHQHNYTKQLSSIKSMQTAPCITRTKQFMEDNLSQPISLEDLAFVAKTTPRSLRNMFYRHYNTSPMSYLKILRLDQAHEQLTKASSGTNISSIALDCGFRHLGRFSKEYKNRFGQAPSTTLKNQ